MANNPQIRHLTFNQTFESSLIERNSEKFAIDKSLIKGIKQNDVSKIIEKAEDGGLQDTKNLYNELEEIEAIVIDFRKRYDEVKALSLIKQKQIENLKNKKDFLCQDSQKYTEIIGKQKSDLEDTVKNLQKITFALQATSYRQNIYQYLKDVLKKDILVLKKRYFDRDVELMRDRTKLKSIRTEHNNKIKLGKRCREVLQSMEKLVHQKQYERTSKINSVCDVLARKQNNQLKRQTRNKQIQETIFAAMTEKLKEEKQWEKILNASFLLKAVLKSKMERLMLQYNHIEVGFYKIKQATSIKTANDFIQRFLTREETYGFLLESISDKEQKLLGIKQQGEALSKDYNQTLLKSEQITEEQKKYEVVLQTNHITVLQDINESLLKIQRQKQLIYEWGVKFLTSYHGYKSRAQVTKQYDKSKIKELFLQVLSVVNLFYNELSSSQNSNKKIESAYLNKIRTEQTILTEQMSERNTRVKTLSSHENRHTEDLEDKEDMVYDDISEIDYLQHNRRAVKKSDLHYRKFRIKTKPF